MIHNWTTVPQQCELAQDNIRKWWVHDAYEAEKHLENFSAQGWRGISHNTTSLPGNSVNRELHLLSSAVTQGFTVHGLLPNAKWDALAIWRRQSSISLNQIGVSQLANLIEFSSGLDGKILTSPLNEASGFDFHMKSLLSFTPQGAHIFPGLRLPWERAHLPGIGHLDAVQRAPTRGSHIADVTWLETNTHSELVKNSIQSYKQTKII